MGQSASKAKEPAPRREPSDRPAQTQKRAPPSDGRSRRDPPEPQSPSSSASGQGSSGDDYVRAPAATQWPWKVPEAAEWYKFKTLSDGTRALWRMADQSAAEFAASIRETDSIFIEGSKVVIYFQMGATHCARRTFTNARKGFTLLKLLGLIESCSVSAAALAIRKQMGSKIPVRRSQVTAYLSKRTVTRLNVSPGQIFVEVSTNTRLERRSRA